MNAILDKKTRWWQEPMVWLIIGLPITAVIGGLTTVMIAVENADTKVTQGYVKEGMGVRVVEGPERKAADLGLSATFTASPGHLDVALDGRLDAAPPRLTLIVVHPTDSRQDMVVQLESSGAAGHYGANYAAMPAGKRRLELAPMDGSWRLSGQWQTPFSGSMRLAAAAHPSVP